MPTRRDVVAGIVAAGVLPRASWSDAGAPVFLAAGKKADGAYALCGLSQNGTILFDLPLPDRGHAAAAHPDRPEAVAFARRPGTFALVIDCRSGDLLAELTAPAERHFYGHGAFSQDGRYLFTTENAYEEGQGLIGVWDATQGYKRVGEFWAGGIGPHEILRLPETDTLVVANGGIDTHPASGRVKLNLPTMEPNLSYLSADGTVLERHGLPPDQHMNSIRHLAVRPDGLVAAALQWQGAEADAPPLLLTHRMTEEPKLHAFGPVAHRAMDGYAGSVAFSGSGAHVAISSPRGGEVQIFDAADGSPTTRLTMDDVCGLATSPDGILITAGTGRVSRVADTGRIVDLSRQDVAWDNHVIPIGSQRG